jgi:hypothetical protein
MMAALAVLAAALAARVSLVPLLQERSDQLARELERVSVQPEARSSARESAHPRAQLASFYRFFERAESADVWLAKIYGSAAAAGLDWRNAEYRLAEQNALQRYHITVPVHGTYAQIRRFVEATLAEVPVGSLDHISFRRKDAGEPRVDAEITLTLHLPREDAQRP